jgi:hypothetical protein
VTIYAVFLKSILLIPLSLSFSAFINPNSFNLTTSYQIALAILSIIGVILTLINLILYIFFIRDNSPFSKLPFACSVSNREELRSAFKFSLGLYGSLSASNTLQNTLSLIFCVYYILALFSLCYYCYKKTGCIQLSIARMNETAIIMGLWLGVCSFV